MSVRYNQAFVVGAIFIGIALLGYLKNIRSLKDIPLSIQRFGKRWGATTDKFLALRVLNTLFYISGMLITITAFGLLLVPAKKHIADKVVAPLTAPFRPDTVLSADDVLKLVNEQRALNGLHELKQSPQLTEIAQQRLDDMIKNQYYAHLSPNNKYYYDLFTDSGFKAGYSCENLDLEFTTDESHYIQDWLNSTKGHKECMLNNKVTLAGYAAGVFNTGQKSSGPTTYLVVGIQAEGPIKSLNPITPKKIPAL